MNRIIFMIIYKMLLMYSTEKHGSEIWNGAETEEIAVQDQVTAW